MSTLWLDTETYSETPIASGHHAYAETAEVLLVPFTWDDQERIHVVDITQNSSFLQDDLQGMIDRAERVVLHNSAFDRTVLAKQGVIIPVEKIDDTMVQALQHSLPGALDKLCELLQVPADLAKSKEGKRLIHLFTKPRPKNMKLRRATRETHPKEWAEFIEYARLDIGSMREVKRRLPIWNLNDTERQYWLLDQLINDRGFAVDLDLARAALRAAGRESERLSKLIDGVTSGQVATARQRDKTLVYLRDQLGFKLPDLRASTVESALERDDLDPRVREVLEIRVDASVTSPAKYGALLRATSSNGRLCGTIQFCGASRTGRDAGRIFQPQNLPRPTLKQPKIDLGIRAMKADVEDLLLDNVMEVCSNAVRGCIVAERGKKLVIADLSNIEGRKVAWLAGEEPKLAKFRAFDAGTGPDIYRSTAGGILKIAPEAVSDDQRQGYGKVPELALGFGGAVNAFLNMAANYGVDLPEETVLGIVRGWRAEHPKIVRLWYDTEAAAIAAVEHPGTVYQAGKYLKFKYYPDAILPLLLMRLPSGRYLCYPHAEIQGGEVRCETCQGEKVISVGGTMEDPTPLKKEVCRTCDGTGTIDYGAKRLLYQGINQYTRQWSVIDTWGGKLIENATQASARDIFYCGARKAEGAGYRVVGRVHDELITETPDTPEFTPEGLSTLMASGPLWSVGLPLAAAGFETYRYRKG